MIHKFLTAILLKRSNDPYAHLPEPIRAEVRAANEATSVYDIP